MSYFGGNKIKIKPFLQKQQTDFMIVSYSETLKKLTQSTIFFVKICYFSYNLKANQISRAVVTS